MKCKNLSWTNLHQAKNVPDEVMCYLDDKTSLTAKLKHKFSDFSVKVLSEKHLLPNLDEQQLIKTNAKCVIREVELCGNGQVVVFARSILPITSDTKDLLSIGSRPLGEILFNDAKINRSCLQVALVDDIWARRSVFTIGTSNILVAEFFLKNLYA